MDEYIKKICCDEKKYTVILEDIYNKNKSITIMTGKGTDLFKDVNFRNTTSFYKAYPDTNISNCVLKHITNHIKNEYSKLLLGNENLTVYTQSNEGIWNNDVISIRDLEKTVEKYLPDSKYMFITQKKMKETRKVKTIPFSQLSSEERLEYRISDDYKIDPFNSTENWIEHHLD